MHFFITGHTGFKGSWLILLLASRGHTVSGLSLNPQHGALYDIADLRQMVRSDFRGDIRDARIVRESIQASSPDVVVHLAAQPLVRTSLTQPRLTVETNVIGTLNVLEAASQLDSVQAQLLVTTDKVYRNTGQSQGYREDDSLGAGDPYSASKAMADLLIQSWLHSFPGPPSAIARAGNVIGGGDVSEDRLFPDLMRSFSGASPARIRYPSAVRPWQHVLDCLNGYLMLIDRVLAHREHLGAWNFGPNVNSFATVAEVSERAARCWGDGAKIQVESGVHIDEAKLLALDSTKSRSILGWMERLDLQEAIEWTVRWTRDVGRGVSPLAATLRDLEEFASISN